ncbi:aminoglycoside phosphotransferase family protein [Paenibacillus sp. P25]|nr:aminoglycoside phosphotransferase family protein [Paenibacillus sp. P25]
MERIIHQAFGIRVVETKELSDGWANSAYTIVTSDGRSVILKVAPFKGTKLMRYEANLMRTEVEALRLFGGGGTPPVPKVFAYDDTCSLIDAEYFIMERLPGVPYNQIKETLSREVKDAIEFELGAYSRLINGVPGEKFGYFLQQESWNDFWPEAFQGMIRGVLADGRDAGVESPAGDAVIEMEIERHLDALREVDQPRFVHWDLWDGNVFVEHGKITGLIDFERALWGDPLMEVYFGRFNRSEGFSRGYGLAIATQNQQRRRVMYDFYLDLILWIECTFRQYENKDHWNWARNNLAEGWDRLLAIGRN